MPRAVAVLTLVAALVAVPSADGQPDAVERGRELYVQGCVSCHGPQAGGVDPAGPTRGAGGIRGGGPPLRGAGAASAHFYLTTGYMPLADLDEQPRRRDPSYSDGEIAALIAYVGSFGGPPIPDVSPQRGDLADGMRLFTENCSGCHQVVGAGGILPGADAPALREATATQIAEAVRIGPFAMPRFGREQISDRELDSIVRYVVSTREPEDPGGWPLGHLGPIPEGMVAWLLAGGALVGVAVLIGGRVRR